MNTMQDNSEPKTRPVLVTILAIFTIIGFFFEFGYLAVQELVPEVTNGVSLPLWWKASYYSLVTGKLVAAIFLLRMQRFGFFMYAAFETVSAVLSVISTKIAMEYMDSSYVNPSIPFDPKVLLLVGAGVWLGLSIAFIGGYAAHLGKMD
jgi:hypothetical protein